MPCYESGKNHLAGMTSFRLTMVLLIALPGIAFGQHIEPICYSDSVITISRNEQFVLKFGACHDCGSAWFLDSVDSTGIQTLNKRSGNNRPFTGDPVAGGSVFEIWTFAGLRSGGYEMLFCYKRFGRIIQKKVVIKVSVL